MLKFGFGFIIGFTVSLLIYLKWINSGRKKKSGFSLNPVTVLNIAAYNGFMAIGLYLNLMFSYVLDESGCFGDWKNSLSPIVYCFVFLLFHKIVQHLTGQSGMTDEIYAVCYQSMLIVQTVGILLLKYYDAASILIAFLCGEIFAVSLRRNRKVRPKAFLRWLKMKCSGFSCTSQKTKDTLTALITNCLLAVFTLFDMGTSESKLLRFFVGVFAGILSAILLIVFLFWYLNREKQPDRHK